MRADRARASMSPTGHAPPPDHPQARDGRHSRRDWPAHAESPRLRDKEDPGATHVLFATRKDQLNADLLDFAEN